MLQFRRVHDSGTDTLVTQDEKGWRIQLNLREPNHNPMTITGYLVPTIERAKTIADMEVSKAGHVCNGSCQNWRQA